MSVCNSSGLGGLRIPGVTTGGIWAAGLGAAILSGIVAAGAALLVSWRADKRRNRSDALVAAKAAVAVYVRALSELSNTTNPEGRGRQARDRGTRRSRPGVHD